MNESSNHPGGGLAGAILARSRQVVLGLLLGGLALAIALWGVPLAAVADALARADLIWLVPPAIMFLLQQVIRAGRQALILQAQAPDHRFRTSLSVLCISFLFINTLPARLGEVVRPLLLLEREGIPVGAGFAAVFLERAIDLCAMLVMIALVAWLVPVPSQTL
ncbi:MAG: lysylphosphatidylglycerol synthase transmembrane domain-containing protein, partial [Myxococcota bacterium]|nr:lysylphosphatidylglycerol synthase transmembrane domain-containing protein [Myxococcota bacterium]